MLIHIEPKIEMIKSLNDTQIRTPSSNVTFEVIVKTAKKLVPYNIKWFKNNSEIVQETDYRYKFLNQYQSEDEGTTVVVSHQLLIESPLNKSDTGNYTLKIDNRYETTTNLYICDGIFFL